MSQPSVDGDMSFVASSLLSLFSPPPMLPPSPKSPSETPVHLKTQFTISTSPKPKHLVIGGQDESTSTNGVGQYPSPPSHNPAPVLRLRLGTQSINAKSREELTASLDDLGRAARSSIREIKCEWRQEVCNGDSSCDATLGSYTLFRKHINRHVAKLVSDTTKVDQPGPSYLFTSKRCGWDGCDYTTSTLDAHHASLLKRHVAKVHLEPLQSTYCPFKGCQEPELPSGESHIDHCLDAPSMHPLPWDKSRLRRSFRPFRPNVRPPPPLPSFAVIPFHTTPPVRPYRPLLPYSDAQRPKRPSRSRAVSDDSDNGDGGYRPLDQVRDIINPDTRLDAYFVENPFHMSSGIRSDVVLSSSIFPNSRAHSSILELEADINPIPVTFRNRKVLDLKSIMDRSPTIRTVQSEYHSSGTAIQTEYSPFDDLAPVSCCPSSSPLVKRPIKGINPVIHNPVQLALGMRNARKRTHRAFKEVKRVKMEPDTGTLDNANTFANAKLDIKQVERAARRHARVKAKRSYGIQYVRTKLDFEKQGEQLGEYEMEAH